MLYLDESYIRPLLKPRKEESSKGDFGTLATLCGSRYMTGAAKLAAEGALRSGLGLLKFFGSDEMIFKMQALLYEPVFANVEKIPEGGFSAFLCGCGIGREYDDILPRVLSSLRCPTVLDADCINFAAAHIDVLKGSPRPLTLTPHPGEMARLLGAEIADVQADRAGTARGFARKHGCVLVLKGHGTVIASPEGEIAVNTTGGSELAKGGSGDVLAGVIASLNAQGYGAFDAACIGVYFHGLAGESLAKSFGKSGVLPGDLPKEIGRLLG